VQFSDGHFDANSICFLFAPCATFLLGVFNRVLGVTPCPKTETCHPEVIRLVPSGLGMRIGSSKNAGSIDKAVIYPFDYVHDQRLGAFPALSRVVRSGSKNFLLSSTEV
jgi:hypothetical protein